MSDGHIMDAVRALYYQSVDKPDDLERAHWLASPEAWMEIRAQHDFLRVGEIQSHGKQSLFGIPLRVGKPKTVPAIDLIIE